jgi:hypothetical protein
MRIVVLANRKAMGPIDTSPQEPAFHPEGVEAVGRLESFCGKLVRSTKPAWLPLCAAVLSLPLVWCIPLRAEAGASDLTSPTKMAYIKIARSHATGLIPQANPAPVQMDMAQIQAAQKELFMDLASISNVDPELNSIIADIKQSEDETLQIRQELERMPEGPQLASYYFQNFYYGATFQFENADKYNNTIASQSASVQALGRRMLQCLDKNEAATIMLARIGKRLAGPVVKEGDPVSVDIAETWGFSGPDRLTLINTSGRTLHNCTVVVLLAGKTGEVKQNVHFVETWPDRRPLYARYDPGQRILDQTAFRHTVSYIQSAEVALFCDEFAREGISYTYAGKERDRHIREYLAKAFNPRSAYRGFSKGVIWDDNRAVHVGFDGLQFIPPGTLTVTLLNGELSAAKRQSFSLWKAGATMLVEFKDITWDPTKWTIRFEFNDTSATRSCGWTR